MTLTERLRAVRAPLCVFLGPALDRLLGVGPCNHAESPRGGADRPTGETLFCPASTSAASPTTKHRLVWLVRGFFVRFCARMTDCQNTASFMHCTFSQQTQDDRNLFSDASALTDKATVTYSIQIYQSYNPKNSLFFFFY